VSAPIESYATNYPNDSLDELDKEKEEERQVNQRKDEEDGIGDPTRSIRSNGYLRDIS
jgi:hypothetical protein